MTLDISKHPCFNAKIRHTFGRIHLPVAPRCNIQCKFCNRKFDCVNESRPGVTSSVLSPEQALHYLHAIMEKKKNISVVGIAGPGDPFANAEETLETLRLVRAAYPAMLLCVASNGLGVLPHVKEMAALQVSHVTITVNAVDAEIGKHIYAWARFDRRVRPAPEAAALLLERQLQAIAALKAEGITVKVNSIIIPGVNDGHIPVIAQKMSELGVDILNCIPLCPTKDTAFGDFPEPSPEMVARVRKEAAQYIPQMHHCTRCRSDAVGLLGEGIDEKSMALLRESAKKEIIPGSAGIAQANADEAQPYVAVASMEGILINQHLGEADELFIFKKGAESIEFVEVRKTPLRGLGSERWKKLAASVQDCRALLVSGIGDTPQKILQGHNINVYVVEGIIEDAVRVIFAGKNIKPFTKKCRTACGSECSGNGMGCG